MPKKLINERFPPERLGWKDFVESIRGVLNLCRVHSLSSVLGDDSLMSLGVDETHLFLVRFS